MGDRAELIAQHFNYLISEYGFQIKQKEYDPATMGNAFVIFSSSIIGIEIALDRGQVSISIGDQLDPRNEWFEFTDIIKYFVPSLANAYVVPQKTVDNTMDEIIEIQLNRLAVILRQYCEPLLKGNLSMIAEIRKNKEERKAELLKRYNRSRKT